jgi:hypothetical protein
VSSNTSTTTYGGPGLSTLLTVLFVALKLCGVITWPWIWVLAPLWIGMGLGLLAVAVILGVTALVVSRK